MPRVIKTDGSRQPFDEENYALDCKEHWKSALSPVSKLKSQFPKHFLQVTGEREVPSRIIGEEVMRQLRELDEVAYVRFASVYRSFQDISEFQAELNRLSKRKSDTAD